MELIQRNALGTKIADGIFLVVLNLVLMTIIGYLTLDSAANLNSKVGGFLLSFFMPIFIVYKTPQLSKLERLIKFGFGFIAYIILAVFIVGVPLSFTTGLLPCLTLALAVLYYGGIFFNKSEQ